MKNGLWTNVLAEVVIPSTVFVSNNSENNINVPVYVGQAKAKIDYTVHSMKSVNDGIEINVSYVGTNEKNSWELYIPEV